MAKKAPKKKKRAQRRVSAKEVLIFAALGLAAILVAGLAHLAGLDGNRAETALRMSEVMSANTATALPGADGWPDWIEIENVSDAPAALTGCALVRESEPSRAFAFPSGTLAAGERVVVLADGDDGASDGAYHAPFRLSSAGETILLLDAAGNTLDRLEIPALGENQVYCRDDSGAWQRSAAPTPGEPNRVESASDIAKTTTVMSGALEITEVMTENVTFGGRDYVEIHNASDAPVSLSGWALSNDEAMPRKWIFPEETLEPDGYYVIECSGEKSGGGASFTLSSDGTAVLLTNPSGGLACRVDVPAQRADQAYSLLESGWSETSAPTPGRANALSSADAFAYDGQNPSGVYLSEILTASTDSDDWIELYNFSSQAVDLSGCGLSNNAKRPRKWQFPSGTVLQPGQYLGVYANGADDGLQTSYRLSAAGGYSVTLSDANGAILDRIYVPEQYSGVSYGRPAGQSALRYFPTPTPGAANAGESYLGRADEVVCSRDGGLFQTGETFTVALSAPSDCKIYYTTDFTDPDETSTPYAGPITVSGQTILRARAFKDGCMPSLIATRSYLYGAKNGGGTVYVVSVVSDPRNLTSDEAGILVRGSGSTPNYMMDWEPEAHVEVFDQNGNLLLSQGCGMRQQGQTCRAEPQQAFKLVARREYGGSSLFRAHLFSRRDYDVCHAFLLRPSNDDQYKTRMRDSVLVTLAEDTSVLYQETEVCVAYIDGEYWGHYNLREVVSPLSICQHEGWEGDEGALDLVKGNNIVLQGSDDTFIALVDWLKANDPTTDEAYRRIDEAVDIQNYIEYMAIQIYSGNTDPSNIKRYRNPNADGKWRWVLFDLDWGFNQDTNSVSRWLTPGGVGNGLRTDNTFFIACMRNPTFRDRFLTHFGQQLATSFSSESVLARFEARYNILKTILPDHWARWNESEASYNRELSKLISYAKSRPTRLLQFLKYSDALKLNQNQMESYFGDAMAKLGLTYDTIPKLK